MDNPAHSGLPKALEPKVELDPMMLFQSPGAVDLNSPQHAPASRGPELAQVFSLPRSAAAAQAFDRASPALTAAGPAMGAGIGFQIGGNGYARFGFGHVQCHR